MYQKPNKRLLNQTAIVTGASSGIGKRTTKHILPRQSSCATLAQK